MYTNLNFYVYITYVNKFAIVNDFLFIWYTFDFYKEMNSCVYEFAFICVLWLLAPIEMIPRSKKMS